MKKININTIVSNYKTVSQIKRMQPTIMDIYELANSKEFFDYVVKPAKMVINGRIDSHYQRAIDSIKNAENALRDAMKNAKKSSDFRVEAANWGLDLSDIYELLRLWFPYVSEDGTVLRKVFSYKTNEDGAAVVDEDGKKTAVSYRFEPLVVTNTNADAVVIRCLQRMKAAAKKESARPDNVKPVGYEFAL